jgi:hypothetical protein
MEGTRSQGESLAMLGFLSEEREREREREREGGREMTEQLICPGSCRTITIVYVHTR